MPSSPINESQHRFPRRVSFDLSHNIVHLLPTLEQCRDAAKQRSREEWQRKTLNEEMLSEDIIIEIQEDCSAGSRDSDEENKSVPCERRIPAKSCLKKPPVAIDSCTANTKKKSGNFKKNQKKRKRNQHVAPKQNVQSLISAH
ncbi:hypothetical protein [Parasitella parasitica]|uniref:Uncharacterized protein n=1 Tax=Parasitella parasitica TaxID=35722 RepID=A0A0B7NK90_9FUNG|nr:hypothetical protein [Parasitella parasitica]